MQINAQTIPRYTVLTRYVQAGLSLLSWCLAISAVALIDGGYWSTDAYGIAVGILTFIWLGYVMLVPARYPKYANGMAAVVGELVMNIFWFTSFIASAAQRGPENCNFSRGWGSQRLADWGSSCKVAKAYIAFAAITWLFFIFSTTFVMMSAMPHFNKGANAVVNAPVQVGGTLGAAAASEEDADAEQRDIEEGLQPEETVHVSDEAEKDVSVEPQATQVTTNVDDAEANQDLGTVKMPDETYQPYTSTLDTPNK